ncbi:Emopamil-binding protein [Myriangium duriaei CBS 260.36]|uniref:Emopamil-binding protein n=1 Tax=Myriangium duriaei CBS 260.36 TaxID=1168546 RepID=A0A9P4IRM9_9PEZI|nr:Emopamil-binding protein [Myriangium duriaei CBS 260.36]
MIANLTGSNKGESIIEHPYYPVGVHIAGYLANESSVPYLLACFAVGCSVIFSASYFVTKSLRPNISKGELLTVMWFVLSGSIHFWFEGYYAINQANMGGLQTLFGQLWKEYALSDSRYLTQNAFVLCMESITAICWGPLCYIVAGMIATDHHLRHPLQAVVSLGQLYGDVLYYATSMFDHYMLDVTYSRPEAFYFWGYYVLMNAFWIVIPGWLLINSINASGEAFKVARTVQTGRKNK